MKRLSVFFLILFLSLPAAAWSADIKLIFGEADNDNDAEYKEAIKESGVMQEIVASLNTDFNLPKTITVVMGGDEGPLYDPNNQHMYMPYAFLGMVLDIFSEDQEMTDDEVVKGTFDVYEFVFYHELAHALVDTLDIPVLGKEEDAADTLATILMLSIRDDGGEAVMATVLQMTMFAELVEIDESAFWDEHSLDIQRAFHVVCMVYGSDPETFRGLLTDMGMPEDERGPYCVQEYETQFTNWMSLLEPYFDTQGLEDQTS